MKGKRETLRIHTTQGFETVNAMVFGKWAAHRARGVDGSDLDHYTTTHVPSGVCLFAVTGQITRGEAEALAIMCSKAEPLEIIVGEAPPKGKPTSRAPTGAGVPTLKAIVEGGEWREDGE